MMSLTTSYNEPTTQPVLTKEMAAVPVDVECGTVAPGMLPTAQTEQKIYLVPVLGAPKSSMGKTAD